MPGGGGCKVSAPMSPPPHVLGCHQRLGDTSTQGGHFPHPVARLLLWSWGQMWARGVLPWGAEEAQPVSQNMALHPVLGQWGAELPPKSPGLTLTWQLCRGLCAVGPVGPRQGEEQLETRR